MAWMPMNSVATADSSLARVVHMVEEAQDRKAHAQRLAERVARPLVPAILVVAAAIAVIGSVLGDPDVWIGRALVVLVAAAPCAFAISVSSRLSKTTPIAPSPKHA